MTTTTATTSASDPAASLFVTRRFAAAPDKVWRFWTTAAGLAAWWGPDGFECAVSALDVRVGGGFDIVMRATAPGQLKYLVDRGIPLESHARGTYTEVDAPRRLAWRSHVDFVPGVAAYDVNAAVDFFPTADGGTEMRFRSDRMHDATWTRNAETGWTQQLDRLVEHLS